MFKSFIYPHFSLSASENSIHLQVPIISQYCQCNWSQ